MLPRENLHILQVRAIENLACYWRLARRLSHIQAVPQTTTGTAHRECLAVAGCKACIFTSVSSAASLLVSVTVFTAKTVFVRG